MQKKLTTKNAFVHFPQLWWKQTAGSPIRQVEAQDRIEEVFNSIQDESIREAHKKQLLDVLNTAYEVERKSRRALERELASLLAKNEIMQDPATTQLIAEIETKLTAPYENQKFEFRKQTKKVSDIQKGATAEEYDDFLEFPEAFQGDKKEAKKYRAFEHEGRTYVIEKNYCRPVSNFTMEIKFHIPVNKDLSHQLVKFTSILGTTKTELINTDDLVTVNAFKKILRRIGGGFSFSGGEASLDKIMDWKQHSQKTARYINTLGYQPSTDLWAWSNEIYNNTGKVIKLDKYGSFTHKKETYMIPANSIIFKGFEEEFEDQRNFRTIDSEVSFAEWSKLHYKVYDANGIIAQAYFMSALFRDHIFALNKVRATPILKLYGQRGCGKGVFADSLMRLYGIPQREISLQSSNTVKGFLRKFAQFRNGLVWLDEYKNSLQSHIQETIKNIYDGVSYTRAKRTNDFQTDSLPIYSSCLLSGEEMPTGNAALFSRTILLSFPPGRDRTPEERERFQKLKRMETNGITNVTKEILKYRDQVINNFEEVFDQKQKYFHKELERHSMDDRFIMNIAILSAVFACLEEYLETPYSSMDLDMLLMSNVKKQFETFRSNDDLGRFWLLVENLVTTSAISHGLQYEVVDGYLYIKIQDVHPLYLKESRLRGETFVLPKPTLENYLSSDPTLFIQKTKRRIGNLKNPVHCFVFDYEAVKERYDVDLEPNQAALPGEVLMENDNNLPFN